MNFRDRDNKTMAGRGIGFKRKAEILRDTAISSGRLQDEHVRKNRRRSVEILRVDRKIPRAR